LLYGIIKNHPFINGNKRIAVYAYLAFVNKNVSELALTDNELKYLFVLATKIARSDPEEKERMLQNVRHFFAYQMLPPAQQQHIESSLWQALENDI
jgi:death-on-curing family protein